MTELQKAALTYTKANGYRPPLPIFAIIPNTKNPIQKGGFYNATTDEQAIREVWSQYPNANIGFRTEGIIVVDVDRHDPSKDGFESLHELEAQHGALPETWIALTPSGGEHYYFRCDDQRLTKAEDVRPGIDYRGCLGYVLLPPSIHPNGGRYEWDAGHQPNETPLAYLPEWLHDILLAATSSPKESASSFEVPEKIESGQRNDLLFRTACSLRAKGLTEKEILAAVNAVNAERCNPPLDGREVGSICESASKYERGEITGTVSEDGIKPLDFSDAGNAETFAKLHRDDLIYTDALGWLRWDGKRWERNDHAAVALAVKYTEQMLSDATAQNRKAKLALATAQAEKDETGDAQGIDDLKKQANSAKDYLVWAKQSRNAPRIRNLLELAKPPFVVKADKLDANPMEINTPEGIVDLTTGLMRPHDRAALCTRMTTTSPSAEGTEMWQAFLDRITCDDNSLKGFLQMVVGMALVGAVYQEGVVLAYGGGRNGKSTFFNAVGAVLGDYTGSIDVSTLTTDRQNRGAALATLRGKRLVLTGELEEGARLSVATLKRLASTDALVIEEKYKSPETIKQTHTLCLFTNHLPRVGSTDGGTWRRLIVCPFNATIEGGETVQNYADVLTTQAGGAILAWAIEGAKNFVRNGCKLDICDAVAEATDDYRQREDWLTNFLDECCVREPNARVSASELYTAYREWAESTGDYVRRLSDFSTAMEAAGYQKIHPKNKRAWLGVKVDAESQYPANPYNMRA